MDELINHISLNSWTIIAATAINNEFTLITRNVSDFKNIEQVNIFNPFN
ncbi:MAG: hypothetical protein ACOCQW_02545 [Halanaerobiaceae bacterium]